ncbi:hypothetical protein DPM13_01080 [Paracoccus mutanolyticus]|uniref:Uncharacterized protein n=1 Tax=Paracoccus mutanolyticus TaxID=1499308 RepID=A0ABN5M3C7_9RHOB|nr:hypothetical protein [Paracoccus mutanolyticus]AWX92337.1 hypothetical protein DPM13_01080 [Paracoccus mutanolyticus]
MPRTLFFAIIAVIPVPAGALVLGDRGGQRGHDAAIDSTLARNLLGGVGGLVIGVSAIINLNALGESVFSR